MIAKRLILLIGSQGTGKSTYAKGMNSTVISQDTQGKDGHWQAFVKAIQNGENVIVDRINHLRQQRMKYVNLARDNGYQITFNIFSEKYEVCLNRIINRDGHETLKKGDVVTARNALDMYFNQFEYPREDEYNALFRPDFIYGHSFEIWNQGRTFIIGDIHGCYEEFINLVNENGYSKNDVVISVGDLNDRGPHSDCAIYRFASGIIDNHYSIRGNHDDKLIRWLRGNKVNAESLQSTINQLGDIDKDRLYYKMMDLPYIIKLGSNNYITHAGFNPNYHPMNNSKEFSMYARHYDPVKKTFTHDQNHKYWFDYKTDDNNYFFGHIIFDEMPKIDKVYALDGGCYKGGPLRAAVLIHNEFSHIIETPSLQPKVNEL